jgi:hypothetical protein
MLLLHAAVAAVVGSAPAALKLRLVLLLQQQLLLLVFIKFIGEKWLLILLVSRECTARQNEQERMACYREKFQPFVPTITPLRRTVERTLCYWAHTKEWTALVATASMVTVYYVEYQEGLRFPCNHGALRPSMRIQGSYPTVLQQQFANNTAAKAIEALQCGMLLV